MTKQRMLWVFAINEPGSSVRALYATLTRDDNGIDSNILWVGATARGALTFFRLTRDDNGIA